MKSEAFFKRGKTVYVRPGAYFPESVHISETDRAIRKAEVREVLGGGRSYGVRVAGHPAIVDYTDAELASSPWPSQPTDNP